MRGGIWGLFSSSRAPLGVTVTGHRSPQWKWMVTLSLVALITWSLTDSGPRDVSAVITARSTDEPRATSPPEGQASLRRSDVFHPSQDVTLEAAHLTGLRAQVERRRVRGRELTIGWLRFRRVVIPAGVTVRFRGFDVVVFQSEGDMEINGVLDVSGTDGQPGTTERGGRGGDGGGHQGGPPVGGAAGGGGFGWCVNNGEITACQSNGAMGQGAIESPGNPRLVRRMVAVPAVPTPGGGGAGGGNGTPGAAGRGKMFDYDPVADQFVRIETRRGQAFGEPLFDIADLMPAGGGTGGGGQATELELTGSGGGGGGGAIFLQAGGRISLNLGGAIRANGGRGGDGQPGTQAGGGGGGAGGFIRLDAREVLMNGGTLEAHGGAADEVRTEHLMAVPVVAGAL